jgi:hypothetical protein
MESRSKRRPLKAKRRVSKRVSMTARRRRRTVSVDSFILTSFIEALRKRGYSLAQAKARAKELLEAPGFAGFPALDAGDA